MREYEYYTLDSALHRNSVIEGYESFIWSERYSDWGDFQIIIPSTPESKSLLVPDTWIGKKDSNRIMKIETVQDKLDEGGKKYLTVAGRSLEYMLDERVAMPAMAGLGTTPQWIISGTPANVIRYMFTQICSTLVLSLNDGIPWYQIGTLLPAGNIPEPGTEYTFGFDPATLYANFKKICDVWPIGYRFVRQEDTPGYTGTVFFEVYTGNNRTAAQDDFPPVIFSSSLESFDKVSILKSSAVLRTCAYVFAQNDAAMVYADGYDSSVSSDLRRILLVDANDIDLPAGAELDAAMDLKGMQELANYRETFLLDGEIPQHQPYIYGTDYGLGDLVEQRDENGAINYMLVTEQIFISDAEGDRSYPTLSLARIIIPGSWLSLPAAEHWNDISTGVHWNDL